MVILQSIGHCTTQLKTSPFAIDRIQYILVRIAVDIIRKDDTPRLGPLLEMNRPKTSGKLLDEVRNTMRARHMSIRTEEAYVRWIREFLRFHTARFSKWMWCSTPNARSTSDFVADAASIR
jgi:hypothetical protein